MWHMIKKENLLVAKNWQSYFLTLIVPVLAVMVNIIISQTAKTTLNVAVVDPSGYMQTLLPSIIEKQSSIKFVFNSNNSINNAIKDICNNKICAVVKVNNSNQISLYYDESRQDSQIAVQYITVSLQKLISSDLTSKYPDLVKKLTNSQKYVITQAKNVGTVSAKTSNLNTMLLIGMIWIFIFTPLSVSMSQIQQEKSSGTMFYLFKIPLGKIRILLAKQSAIIVQCLLATFILICITRTVGISDYVLKLWYLPMVILIILSISSIGYFFGFVLEDSGSSVIVVLLLTLPTMLVTSLNTTTALDTVIKFIPSYYSSQLLRQMLVGDNLADVNIILTVFFALFFFILSALLFERKDPMKLCKTL